DPIAAIVSWTTSSTSLFHASSTQIYPNDIVSHYLQRRIIGAPCVSNVRMMSSHILSKIAPESIKHNRRFFTVHKTLRHKRLQMGSIVHRPWFWPAGHGNGTLRMEPRCRPVGKGIMTPDPVGR